MIKCPVCKSILVYYEDEDAYDCGVCDRMFDSEDLDEYSNKKENKND